jgi:hypothetical protein
VKTIAMLLLVVAIAFGEVMEGTSRYSDCAFFDGLIASVLGSNDNYLTMIGADNGTSTYNVFAPRDYWEGTSASWGVLHVCFLAAGYASQASVYTSNNCNVLFADRMYTMSTANCRRLIDMRGTDAYIFGWIEDHTSFDTSMGCDDIVF